MPESVIVETTEYKCLQSQFSVLYNESMQIKTLLDDVRNQLQTSKNTHLRQIEMMEGEELQAQKRVRSEMIQMEDILAQIRKEYEMLRIEFEQNMAANEQTAPINREMRHLITSLQNHNAQLKGEVHRYKRKYKEVSNDNVRLRKDLEELTVKMNAVNSVDSESVKQENCQIKDETPNDGNSNTSSGGTCSSGSNSVKEEGANNGMSIKSEPDEMEDDKSELNLKDELSPKHDKNSSGTGAGLTGAVDGNATNVKKEGGASQNSNVKTEKDSKDLQKAKEIKIAESEMVRELKIQLKKAVTDQKEMKLLLDMYKGVSKEQRDKVQLMASEKKIRAELEELRNHLKKIQESKREERKKLVDEDAQRKIKMLEDQIYELQKQVANQKPPPDGTWSGGSYRSFVGSHVV